MLIRNRNYERKEPDKDAILFVIFCEGRKTEYGYFNYFHQISSRVRIEVIPPQQDGDNSPVGLYNTAEEKLLQHEGNLYPEYQLTENDEVFFVVDTDKWGRKLIILRDLCSRNSNWHVMQSNPCFEIWLYYHFYKTKPNSNITKQFKQYLNEKIPGGFDNRKHPSRVREAIENSEKNYIKVTSADYPLYNTDVYVLAQKILNLIDEDSE